jgi:hypothetical protein
MYGSQNPRCCIRKAQAERDLDMWWRGKLNKPLPADTEESLYDQDTAKRVQWVRDYADVIQLGEN